MIGPRHLVAVFLLAGLASVAGPSCVEAPASPEDRTASSDELNEEAEQALLKVFCKKEEHGAPCSARCLAAGIGCVYGALHPRKPEASVGLLYACNSLTPGYMCSYTYTNGDTCHFPFGRPGLSLCVYTGSGDE